MEGERKPSKACPSRPHGPALIIPLLKSNPRKKNQKWYKCADRTLTFKRSEKIRHNVTLLTMKISLLILLISASSLTGSNRNTNWRLEDQETDSGEHAKILWFQTKAGVRYTLQHSEDLSNWDNVQHIYGLGHEVSIQLFTHEEVTATSDPNAAVPSETILSFLRLGRPSIGGVLASWPSLDHGDAVHYHLSGSSLVPEWNNFPLFRHDSGDYAFYTILNPAQDLQLPDLPSLGPMDSAMISAFATTLPQINSEISALDATAVTSPVSVSPPTGSRGWYRLVADWGYSGDGDSRPDWVEFEAGDSDPFNGDTDGDGIPDTGDFDGDGIPDNEDAAIDDSLIDWKTSAGEPHYILIPVGQSGVPIPVFWPSSDAKPKFVGRNLPLWSGGIKPFSISAAATDGHFLVESIEGDIFGYSSLPQIRTISLYGEEHQAATPLRQLPLPDFQHATAVMATGKAAVISAYTGGFEPTNFLWIAPTDDYPETFELVVGPSHPFRSLSRTPSGRLLLSEQNSSKTWMLDDNGSWQESSGLHRVTELSLSGTGITSDGKIWEDGEYLDPKNLCPALRDGGFSQIETLDINDGGVILIQVTKAGSKLQLLANPIQFEDPISFHNDVPFKKTDQLKIAKFDGGIKATGGLQYETDRDRFRISMGPLKLPATQKVFFKMGTKHPQNLMDYNDPAHGIVRSIGTPRKRNPSPISTF